MNYQRLYNSIISRAQSRHSKPQGERHHIIPKCLGGSNSIKNLVDLSYREHLICHKLLTKIHPTNQKLKYALYKLNNYYGSTKSSRSYQRIKREFTEHQRYRMLNSNPMKGRVSSRKGTSHSKETIKKISERTKELFLNPEYRKKQSLGVSKGVSGSKHPFYGKHHSEDSLRKAAKSKGCRSFNVYLGDTLIGTWWSQSKCCRDLDLKSVGNLNACLKRGTTYKGFRFQYL
jgi:hypothetical protein